MPQHSARPARVPPRALMGLMALAISAALPASVRAGEARGIAWRSDLAAAEAEARARNLPLWIQFTGPWCIYCKKMDMFAFADPAIVARSQTAFVPVKIRSDAREDLVVRFSIASLPSSVILSPSGKMILGRSQGYADAPTFASVLDSAWANNLADPEVLAMSGYCPVRLVEGKGRVKGDPRLALFHDGHAYRFADASARDLFLKDPEKYLPSDGGRCVVTRRDAGKTVAGDPRFGATYKGRLYLFADASAREKFATDPDGYHAIDLADNGACPHCKGTAPTPVVGKPEFASTHSGKRYLFPDDAHRQAFRAAPDRYIR
jgi:YHS domain-containing protein/thiol-disulfide isomerase/thioredoxin